MPTREVGEDGLGDVSSLCSLAVLLKFARRTNVWVWEWKMKMVFRVAGLWLRLGTNTPVPASPAGRAVAVVVREPILACPAAMLQCSGA